MSAREESQSSAGAEGDRCLELSMDSFGWETLEQQSARLGVSELELVRFALMYYLADLDSGRIARLLPSAGEQRS